MVKSSVQEKLGRVRPPRVKITYDIEIGDAIEQRELPFVVGILADLSGESSEPLPALHDRSFVDIDRENFHNVMGTIKPRLDLKWKDLNNQVINNDKNKAAVGLEIESIDDFYPTNLATKIPNLIQVYSNRRHLRDLLAKLDGNDELFSLLNEVISDADKQSDMKETFDGIKGEEWGDLTPDGTSKRVMDDGGMYLENSQKPFALTLLGAFTTSVIGDGISLSASEIEGVDCVAMIESRIGHFDEVIEARLNAVMHHPDFQQLEGSWRGLHYLVFNTETSTRLKLRVLKASKADLVDDFKKAVEFDQSALYKIIHEKEYGTYAGEPYSVLIGDYEIGTMPTDMEFLRKMSEVAAAAHTPFITNANAKIFDLTEFSELQKPRDFAEVFESQEKIEWRQFRELEDSRYVTLTLPRVLARLPYDDYQNSVSGLVFTESINKTDAKELLWMGSSFALAQRITTAFSLFGWTAAISGMEGGGLVEGLPSCPTELAITEWSEKELNELGFMAICYCKKSDKTAFFGGRTTATVETPVTLPYVLPASRFAHFIKVIMREKTGSFMTRGNVEDYLSSWISQYVLLDDSPPEEVKARYPLREASVSVADVPGKPGSYRATVFLEPHFQLEEPTSPIRFVVELPS